MRHREAWKRESGILLHISSLPSKYGIGDLGPSAYRFVDFLVKSGQGIWQILPLNPTSPAYGNSPYSSYSAFAGNPFLISPEILVQDGYLLKSDLRSMPPFPTKRVQYDKVCRFKKDILFTAFTRCRHRIGSLAEFQHFLEDNSFWLENYTLFIALKKHFGNRIWSRWPKSLRYRDQGELEKWKNKLEDTVLRESFFQFLFFTQWARVRNYCREHNIRIIGDLPIYVNYDSSDVWSHPRIFKLDEKRKMTFVSGVPPDYFSKTGQLWGNPVYNWDALKKKHYSWWIDRLGYNMRLFDITRIDHFRGFVAFWEVRSGEKNAMNGKWVNAPAMDFFTEAMRRLPGLHIIAEDLGVITPDVREVMNHFGFPGMKLLLFAFGDDDPGHPYLPHNYPENCIVYTGTHDNNTAVGWFKKEARSEEKKRIENYIGRKVSAGTINRELIKLAMKSAARTAIFPMQDILGLDEDARMNHPSSARGNWEWKLHPRQLTSSSAERLFRITKMHGRI
ncbi:4-alpha-glucanotransferase [bacterium BMS3Abin07]|nr:4-alpha-glucanotransferase [bacterium BMS3Abin07]GBE33269.1 4-alpha-glucanotransferase [bacterium BMS3Bbin05]HDL19805.1 4-alpha-glucanotransferase [Nitrospirota bacterium]HDO23100.1 4-alpha-glucanotransferase [Nitrospirota bacterium]HDZ88141.1 4-alpha-glucanotransferase [Nitrospirota bacterium]